MHSSNAECKTPLAGLVEILVLIPRHRLASHIIRSQGLLSEGETETQRAKGTTTVAQPKRNLNSHVPPTLWLYQVTCSFSTSPCLCSSQLPAQNALSLAFLNPSFKWRCF